MNKVVGRIGAGLCGTAMGATITGFLGAGGLGGFFIGAATGVLWSTVSLLLWP